MNDLAASLSPINSDVPDGYTFNLTPDDSPDSRFVIIEATTPTGTRRLAWTDPDRFFDGVRTAQGELIEHELGQAWPRCPTHGSHPLKPEPDAWHCPSSPDNHWDYGTLKKTPVVPEPQREDGEVRWWMDDLAWGVVADHEGDLFVLWSMIEGTGYKSLVEGERVEYQVATARPGRFQRRAQWVRRST